MRILDLYAGLRGTDVLHCSKYVKADALINYVEAVSNFSILYITDFLALLVN